MPKIRCMMGATEFGTVFFTAYKVGVVGSVRSEQMTMEEWDALKYHEKYKLKEDLKQQWRDKFNE